MIIDDNVINNDDLTTFNLENGGIVMGGRLDFTPSNTYFNNAANYLSFPGAKISNFKIYPYQDITKDTDEISLHESISNRAQAYKKTIFNGKEIKTPIEKGTIVPIYPELNLKFTDEDIKDIDKIRFYIDKTDEYYHLNPQFQLILNKDKEIVKIEQDKNSFK